MLSYTMLNYDNTFSDMKHIAHSLCTTHFQNTINVYDPSHPPSQKEIDTYTAPGLTHLQINPKIYQHNQANYTG
jgi:hypothetical protein